MPLSSPQERELIHTRQVTVRGYRRPDGRFDIEGHMSDIKTYDFDNRDRGGIAAGEPIHEMWLRLTVDEDLYIHRAEAATEHGPFSLCPAIAPDYARLEGLTIGPGFNRKVRTLLGGVKGCTHLTELLGPIATTAFQTIFPLKARRAAQRPSDGGATRPPMLDQCHALAADGPVVAREWPAFYRPDPDAKTGGV